LEVTGCHFLVDGTQFSCFLCLVFHLGHGTEFQISDGQDGDHQDGKDGIHIVRDGGKESCHFIREGSRFVEGGTHGRRPAGNRSDDADRSCSGIDDIGQFCPGNPIFVRDRLHDGPHGQTVEIIVDENQDS
jgi:hypothetical protein